MPDPLDACCAICAILGNLGASDVDFDLVSTEVRESGSHMPIGRRLGYAMSVRYVVIKRKCEMKAKVSWVEGMKFVGESESGHQVTLDGANPGEGASPMEMILLAVGGCSSIDVVSILEKARQSVTACHVELEGQRVESVPRVFEKIHLNFVVTGKGLAEKQVARAVDLSMEKYCSVSLMLEKAVEITHSYQILEA
ncbi:osmotically inducible protein OsmC [Aeromonas salmonicida]|nr:osmotically inducible protein OsmC [Aeromonas salmonicida]TNI80654.1 osmotically inducible protein OsmC [Aeromonas salmonicida]